MNHRLMTGEPVRFDGVALQAVQLAGVTPEPAWLNGPETVRAERFATAELRRDFIARRTAVRIFAAALFDLDPAGLAPRYSCPEHGTGPELDHGRPGFAAQGEALPISLSSSSRRGWLLLGAAAAPGSRLGVDLEWIASVGFEGFDDLVLSAAERQDLAALPAAERLPRRARIWSRKEAWSKAEGSGLQGRISGIDSAAAGIVDIPNQLIGLPEGFVAAQAVQSG
ncbi:4'-phosphopantetheinyl transferase family protein [Arthrobacter russicus]|uniref:4'-phosphopantetheinyl transferase n=1 Tax=Arthrobacter russicus TaxID=172040 RepID=A0ABU1JHH2_9MICC|nr:4'-phosphopantetheinyl transferase superfamily protein [Arthrobacter russicus]MDR6270831.1 4'-phosphopantetheinyl transferase [Arthrobacter russicus]